MNAFVPGNYIYPKSPIITYFVKVGVETLNPQLKTGSFNLLRQIKSRHYPLYGFMRSGFNEDLVRSYMKGNICNIKPVLSDTNMELNSNTAIHYVPT